MTNNLIKYLLPFYLLAVSQFGFSAEKKEIVVLPTTDTTGLGLTSPVQKALKKLFARTEKFNALTADYIIGGYTASDLKKAFEAVGDYYLTFAFIEPTRVAIFLFNPEKSKEYIVSTSSIPKGQELTPPPIEASFTSAFNKLMRDFNQNKYAKLPGGDDAEDTKIEAEETSESLAEYERKLIESRALVKELSDEKTKKLLIGGSVGMVRFKGKTSSMAGSNAALSVGIQYRFSPKMTVGLGMDGFSYLFSHLNIRYSIPVLRQFVVLSPSFGLGMVGPPLSQNKGYAETSLNSGSMLFGPGISIDIPLIGATMRGDIRFYSGSESVFVGTYGLHCPL